MNRSTASAPARPLPLFLADLSLRRFVLSRRLLLILPWIGFGWQCLLSTTSEDVICAALAASGSFLVLFDSFRPERFYRTPLSTLVVLGFAVTLQLGPLLFTAIEGHSLTFNLVVPIATFSHGVLSSLVCLLAHALYRQSSWFGQIRAGVQRLLLRLKLFQPLRSIEVVVMGAVGAFALAITSWFSDLAGQSILLVKFVEGFRFLSIIPVSFVLQPLSSQQARLENVNSKRQLTILIIFSVVMLLVSVGRNSRGSLAVPLACLFLGLAFEWLYGFIRIRLNAVLAVGLAVVLLLPLATDVATAMVMVRVQRTNVTTSELFSLTFNQLEDREAIQRFRDLAFESGSKSDWSESYVSNIFLARLSNAKFPDNSLDNFDSLTLAARAEMASYQWLRLLTILPSPVLSVLGVSSDIKSDINSFSFGDKLYFLASGSKYALGGLRTGHFFGTGMAGFGFWYVLLLYGGLLLIFPLVDSFALIASPRYLAAPLISVLAVTNFYQWFTFSNMESVISLLSFSLRGFFEPILLFSFLRWLISCL